MEKHLWKEPLILNHNRVKRAYTGGKLLDQWQGIEPAADGQFPEEFLISTVEVTNPDRYPGEGLSQVTLADGSQLALRDIIASNPAAFLGEAYRGEVGGDLGVLARVGDPTVRHVIQAHPDTAHARTYLKSPHGKTEAWYIIQTRDMQDHRPFAYAGFKPGMTREGWKQLFLEQDITTMLAAMHKIEFKAGDMLLIEAGLPHALGPGSMFLEVHEPCDYTFRMEKKYLTGRVFSDEEIHYGIGLDRMLDGFHYDTYSYDQIKAKVLMQPRLIYSRPQAREYRLISHEQSGSFAVHKVETSVTYKASEDRGHRIAIVTQGFGFFCYAGGRKAVRQGQGIFLPAGIEELEFCSDGSQLEIILAYPPALEQRE